MNTLYKLPSKIFNVLVVFALVGEVGLRSQWIQAAPVPTVRIGIVLDKGGKDDGSFNAAAYRGVMKFQDDRQGKAFVKYVEATDDNAFAPLLRSFAQKNFDLIIAVGVSQVNALKKVAAQFPNLRFAIVDGQVDAPNVQSLLFEEHEGAYVVGVVAALTSKTGVVGFIGGMDIPIIRRFEMGYEAGVKKINPKTKVLSNFIGMTADAWNNPTRAKELAVTQYRSGADVIFAAAGASGIGLFDAAEEQKKFAIGVDSNQNGLKPGSILTSMVKYVDHAVYTFCKDVTEDHFKPGVRHFGLANHGVDYALDSNNDRILPQSVRNKVDAIKRDVITGKVHVPDFYSKVTK